MSIRPLVRTLPFHFRLLFAVLALPTLILAQAGRPSAADGFDPNVDGNVFAVATQADGKILIAGQFGVVRPQNGDAIVRQNLARLNADGSVDESFTSGANGLIRAIALQSDGRIIVGGDFTSILRNNGAAFPRNRVARLNPDGSLDAGFDPNLGGTIAPQVYALLVQADGRLIVGGSFTTVQPNGAATATTHRYLARFTSAGALDTSFQPGPNSLVLALTAHVDNKVIVGGGFTSFQPNGLGGVITRNRVARLNPNGTVDGNFDPNANNGVTALAVQRDGKVLLGGYFTTVQPIGSESATNRGHIARLNVDGTLDSEFFPDVAGTVTALAVQPDGALLIGGSFASVWSRGTATAGRNNLARLNPDGTLDTGFTTGANGMVTGFAFQPDGKVVLSGYFTAIQSPAATTGISRNRVARLQLANGALDTTFESSMGGRPLVSVSLADGRTIIGGSFTSVGGSTHHYLARLDATGAVDPTYNPGFNERVLAMAVQSDGRLVVAGAFTTVNGVTRNRVARLDGSGALDLSFNPNPNSLVGSLALQSDGKIVIGGGFTTLQANGAAEVTLRSYLARLNSDGTVDTAFNPGAASTVAAIKVLSDGKILVGGAFSSFAPNAGDTLVARGFIARLNADGTVDTAFNPNANAQVSAIDVQSDGKIVVGGAFTAFLPNPTATSVATDAIARNRIARINADGTLDTAFDPNANAPVYAVVVQADQKIVVGGSFLTLQPNGAENSTLRKYIARLNTNGTVDDTFNLDVGEISGSRVDSLTLQRDGKLLIGGSFLALQPINSARIARRYFARINTNGSVDTTFEPGAGGASTGLVNALAVQGDGKVVAVGQFADLGTSLTTNIARFNAEGTPDSSFNPQLFIDGPVNAVAIRPNATEVNAQLNGFVWLNREGSLNTTFRPGTDARISGRVNAMVLQSDGRIILGGAFANLSSTTTGNLVRFNPNGTLDTSFNPNPNGEVFALALQDDGSLIVGGSFTLMGSTVRNRIARLFSDGTLDGTYDPNASATVNLLKIQTDGKVIAGGAFTTFTPNASTSAVSRNYLARLNTDGSVDTYNPSPDTMMSSIGLQADGKLVVAGLFSYFTPNAATTAVNKTRLARITTDGIVDAAFEVTPNEAVNVLVIQPDGKIIIGGSFTGVSSNGTAAAVTRYNIARINTDNSIDGFDPFANGSVTRLALQPDGSVVLGGTFTTLRPNGASVETRRRGLARVTAAGALDPTFDPNIEGSVVTVAATPTNGVLIGGRFATLQPNGSLVVGGAFNSVDGVAVRNLAILNNDGGVNLSFQPNPNGAVNALLAQSDGRILAGGAFTNIGGVARNRLARFSADGVIDSAFSSAMQDSVTALAQQGDGRILVGTAASTDGAARNHLFRLNPNGTIDTSFNPTGLSSVTGIAVQADGRILVLGSSASTPNRILRLNADGSADTSFTESTSTGAFRTLALQADGRVIVGGAFTALRGTTVSRLARLNSNGTVDTSFGPAPDGTVTAIALQLDGRLLTAGGFQRVGGLIRPGLARLATTSSASQIIGVAAPGNALVLQRSGPNSELTGVSFERSFDRQTWTNLGQATRISTTSNWQLNGVSLPTNETFYIRARGITPSPAGSASGVYETVREFNFGQPTLALPTSGVAALTDQAHIDPFFGTASSTFLLLPPTAPSQGNSGSGDNEVPRAPLDPIAISGRLANLSTLAEISGGSSLITGFTISGSGSRTVLLRAAGPSLTLFDVQAALANPQLRIYDSSGRLLASNGGWNNSTALSAVFARTGAFPFIVDSTDAATVLALLPGSYSMHVANAGPATGTALAEIYDVDLASGTPSKLINLSSRGVVTTSLVGGLYVSGHTAKRFLVRGIGPSLSQFHVNGVLSDPIVSVYDQAGQILATNNDWDSAGGAAAAALQVGAFPLNEGSTDAALIVTISPGAYSIQVTGRNAAKGEALVEVYELP